MKPSVLITGVTGFIGSHVADRFLAEGYNVGGLIRPGSKLKWHDTDAIIAEHCALEDIEGLKDVVKRYDRVVHIAAAASDWGAWEKFYETNVTGTINVLKAAHDAGHEHVVITGSISTYGEEDCQVAKDETYPSASHYNYCCDRFFPCKMNYYRDSKAMSKAAAVKYAKENGLNLTIIEPVWVYGEREFSSGFYEYIRSVQDGMSIMPGWSKNRFHVVYVRDIAKAYQAAVEKAPKGVQSFIIGNSEAPHMQEFHDMLCDEAGVKRPIRLPKWVFYPMGFKLEALYTILRIKKPPGLTRGRVNTFYDNIVYDTSKAKRILGISCDTPLREGIAAAIGWYREMGYLK